MRLHIDYLAKPFLVDFTPQKHSLFGGEAIDLIAAL